jgi:hypothetical protein
MKHHLLYLLIYTSLAASCSFTSVTDEETHLKPGDTVRLNKSLTVPDLYSHVTLQDGELIRDGLIQQYKTSCIIGSKSLGPKTIRQNDYKVSKVSYYEDMYSDPAANMRYYTEFYLNADKPEDNLVLTCQVLDAILKHHVFPLSEIRRATGSYFTFSSIDNKQ